MTQGAVPDALPGLWRKAIPLEARRATGRILYPLAVEATLARAKQSLGTRGEGLPALVGFFDGASGIALSVQLASRALDHLGIAHRKVDVGDPSAPLPPDTSSSSAWLYYLNAPELLAVWRAWGVERLSGSRFGSWAWELPNAPRLWLRTAAVLDGIIAPSRYTASAFDGSQKPVYATLLPMFAADFTNIPRYFERLPGEAFRVVTLFDFKSSMARKNPFGAVDAFDAAFGADGSVRMIIKTHNASFAPEQARALRQRAGANVEIIDAVWDRLQVLSFIASADVLISLHRAEGFGLVLAEAMILGTPVVATGWSSNLDFMDEHTACLVPATLKPIADPQGIYRGQRWADPDIAAAAAYLRRLRDDQDFANAMSARAKVSIIRDLSPEAWCQGLPQALRETFRRGDVSMGSDG